MTTKNDSTPTLITKARPAPARGYVTPRPGSCIGQMLLAALGGTTLFDFAVAYLCGQATPNPQQAVNWAGWYLCDYQGSLATYGYDVYVQTVDGRDIYTVTGPMVSTNWLLDAKAAVSTGHRGWCTKSVADQIASGQQLGKAPRKAIAAKAAKVAAKRMRMPSAAKRAASKATRAKIAKDLGFTS